MLTLKKKRIIYIQFTNASSFSILAHGGLFLASQGWDVEFLGVLVRNNPDVRKIAIHPRLNVREMMVAPSGWRLKLDYLAFVIWVLYEVAMLRPTAIYCSEQTTAPIGLLANWLFRVPVVFHEHDPPQAKTTGWVSRFSAKLRMRIARTARVCVIPNPERAEKFQKDCQPKRVLVVANGVSRSEVLPRKALRTEKGLVLWYQGMLVPDQLPLAVVEALVELPNCVSLRFVGVASGSGVNHAVSLSDLAVSLGVADRVSFLGTPTTRTELYTLMASADVGLALFRIPFNRPMAGASQKPFEYLAAGLPLLVPDIPEWNRFAVEQGYGISCIPSDPASIARAVQWFLDHPEQTRAMGEAGRQRVLNEWNYETLFEPVKQILEAASNSKKHCYEN